MSERTTTDRYAGPMPLHNLLVHVVGYADRGCAGCDWLRARGFIPPVIPPTTHAAATTADTRDALAPTPPSGEES